MKQRIFISWLIFKTNTYFYTKTWLPLRKLKYFYTVENIESVFSAYLFKNRHMKQLV